MQRVSSRTSGSSTRVREREGGRDRHRAAARRARASASEGHRRDPGAAPRRGRRRQAGASIDTRVGFDSARAGKSARSTTSARERRRARGRARAHEGQQAKIAGILQPAVARTPAGPIRSGSGGMIWPVNGPITSRSASARAWEACHPGIDIAVPAGTPIRAADGGRVVIAGWHSGGYGNYTCIQHTASLSTCYAHQSSFGVSVGQQRQPGPGDRLRRAAPALLRRPPALRGADQRRRRRTR